MPRPTETEIIAVLREAADVLEVLRRCHGADVSAACYPALNHCRDMLAHFPPPEREHELSRGCWCGPTVEKPE